MMVTITPSYINSLQRFKFSKNSLKSFRENGGDKYPMIVIDDKPRNLSLINKPIKRLLENAVTDIYTDSNTTIIRRPEGSSGSRSAVLDGAMYAKSLGFKYAFLHLDDNVYVPKLNTLLKQSLQALETIPNLQCVRLTGRPILSNLCSPTKGNKTHLTISKSKVSFEKVELLPKRFDKFTLWQSPYKPETIDNYWVIAMWSSVYRLDFLIDLIKTANQAKHLGSVEVYFQNKNNWKKFLKTHSGEFGYINMQFSGLESQRNKNWKTLINYPNKPVL